MRAIIAVNNLGYVGLNNSLPWRCPEDLKHFKKLTLENDLGRVSKLLVGYNTANSLPNIPNRELVVDVRTEYNLDVDWCIGGKKTYEKYAKYLTELHISYIDDNTIGDTMFPDLKGLNPECKIFKYYF